MTAEEKADHDKRSSEDFKFFLLCHAKGNPAMYELLRDRSLDADPQRELPLEVPRK